VVNNSHTVQKMKRDKTKMWGNKSEDAPNFRVLLHALNLEALKIGNLIAKFLAAINWEKFRSYTLNSLTCPVSLLWKQTIKLIKQNMSDDFALLFKRHMNIVYIIYEGLCKFGYLFPAFESCLTDGIFPYSVMLTEYWIWRTPLWDHTGSGSVNVLAWCCDR